MHGFKKPAVAFAAMTMVLPGAAHAATSQAGARDTTARADAGDAGSTQMKRKYCLVEGNVGSRIQRKVCKTRAQWLKDGVDVGAL